jgi:hypothetical protein
MTTAKSSSELGISGRPAGYRSPAQLATSLPKHPIARWKKACFALIVTAAFFLLFEMILFAAGVRPLLHERDPYVGFSSTIPLFVERMGSEGQMTRVTADNRLRLFNQQQFSSTKSADTYRIFCLGGSTTYGRPYDDRTSFAGWLREFLPEADKSRQWEVINAGGISYASYRVTLLMQELVQYEPDLFIVYTGHNEFLETRTYRSVLDTPPLFRNIYARLAATRTFSVLERLSGAIRECRYHFCHTGLESPRFRTFQKRTSKRPGSPITQPLVGSGPPVERSVRGRPLRGGPVVPG